MVNEIDGKIDDTAILFLLVQNRHQTLIGSGANGLGIQEWGSKFENYINQWDQILENISTIGINFWKIYQPMGSNFGKYINQWDQILFSLLI